jgi:hypothetical protein
MSNPRGLIPGQWYAVAIEDCCVVGTARVRFHSYQLRDGDEDGPEDVIGRGVYWFDQGGAPVLGLEQWGWKATEVQP